VGWHRTVGAGTCGHTKNLPVSYSTHLTPLVLRSVTVQPGELQWLYCSTWDHVDDLVGPACQSNETGNCTLGTKTHVLLSLCLLSTSEIHLSIKWKSGTVVTYVVWPVESIGDIQ
jgi:hypothetical protein